MTIIPVPITIKESAIVANARRIEISEISRRKISILDFPFARLKIFNVAMAKVLVFIPPPVDAGEAPIHINNITKRIVGRVIADESIELNPAVLGVVAPNIAVIILPIPECSERVLLYLLAV